jgi:putative ABC transport system permease protein
MLFFAGCLSLGMAFLSAVSHLLSAADGAVALRARELLSGDVQAVSSRPFLLPEEAAFRAAVTSGRKDARAVSLASMLAPEHRSEPPFLVAVKAVDGAYPLRGALETTPRGRLPEPGSALLERSAGLQHGLQAGDFVRLGDLRLRIAALIDKEPDRDFLGFSFAPRLLIASADLAKAGLLGVGTRARWSWTLALADDEDPVAASRVAKESLEKRLPDAHVALATYSDGESSVRDGLRRTGIFFTALSLAALLLGAAGLRAGLTLFLNAESPSMGLLRCLGATSREIEVLYGGLCGSTGLLGGLFGGAAGWALAAAGASAAARFGLTLLCPPRAEIFAECAVLSAALAWGLSAARVRALASRSPLDALRETPPAPRGLVLAGWAAVLFAAAFAAWRRAPSSKDAALLVAALAAGTVAVELLSRGALKIADALTVSAEEAGLPFPLRHGLRRLIRRPAESRVMLFTLAGGFALLAAVGAARQGFARALAPAQAADSPDIFLIDVQPPQVEAVRACAQKFSRGPATFAPLVRARLTEVDGAPLGRDEKERGRWRSREYNLTYADAPNPSEEIVAGNFWSRGSTQAQASVERDFADRAGLKLGSVLRFDVAGREVMAPVTSIRRVEWASMRPNFFVTLTPALIDKAPRTFIASLRARDPASAARLRRELNASYPNVSVIDAGALLETARKALGLMLTAVEALAWFCVAVGALVVAGLIALGRGERAGEGALERVLGFSAREALAADAAELTGLGALSAICGAAAGLGLSWALSRRLEVPLTFDPKEAAALFVAAIFLPALAGLLAGAPARGDNAFQAARRTD